MVNVEGSLLTHLGDSAVLAAIVRAVSDPAVQGSRHVMRACRRHGSVLAGLHPRCTEPEKRQGLRQVNQSLGFQPLVVGKAFASVLLVEQCLQTAVYAFRELQTGKIRRKL